MDPSPAALNPHVVAGSAALVIALLSLLVYAYRRRLFILCWVGAWLLLGSSILIGARGISDDTVPRATYAVSQFLGVVGALAFVVAADAYRRRLQLTRRHGVMLLPIAIFVVGLPMGVKDGPVFAVGHLLIAGALAAAAVAHVLLLRFTRLLGAAIIGAALLTVGGLEIWIGASIAQLVSSSTTALVVMSVMFLVAALGQQLMAFEDMTYELQMTNRHLETAQNELRQLVITDALTGTRNRRFFDEVIGRELQRHRRYRSPLSIVFIDIDRFKAINDTMGHETGDRVLREVAIFLLRNIREADYVFRWGGDEFLVLISCNEQEALRRATTLQQAFVQSPTLEHLPPGVALSIGCVEVPPDTEDILPLIQSADERMYDDKKRHHGERQREH